MRRGQISVEYLIVVSFIIFMVLSFLGVAVYYTAGIRDELRVNHVETYANKIISNAESVFFAGSPSKLTVSAYLPEGVTAVTINDATDQIVITLETNSGTNIRAFSSDVPIQGTLTSTEGLRSIEIRAEDAYVVITGS